MHKNFRLEAEKTIDILLRFTLSDVSLNTYKFIMNQDETFKIISFWALKDYILLNHDHLISDINGIIQAFVNGCIYEQEEVNVSIESHFNFYLID